MIPTVFTALGLATNILSVAGQALLSTIFAATSIWVPGSMILTGNQVILPDSSTTTSPAIYLNDETTPIATRPITIGTEYCEGHTGALLCNVHIKLTGSGAHRNNNAGSYTCGTSTCSVVNARVFTEAIPRANERLYGGWTTSPGTSSGAQLFNFYAASSGATVIGSGAYVTANTNGLNVEKDIPPGATLKFVWALGNGSEDYNSYKAMAVITFWKYYNP